MEILIKENGEMENALELVASNGPKIKLTMLESLRITSFMVRAHSTTMMEVTTKASSLRTNVMVLARAYGLTMLSTLATGNLVKKMVSGLLETLRVRLKMVTGERVSG